MALKQKRGPGFKYASNLPGSLLREQKPAKEEGDVSSAAKRRPDKEETPRYRPEESFSRQPPVLSPSNLPRPRPEDKLRKKRKLFDDDEEEDLSVRKKVCIMYNVVRFIRHVDAAVFSGYSTCTKLMQVILVPFFFFLTLGKVR